MRGLTDFLWSLAWTHFKPTNLSGDGTPATWTTEYDPACTFTGTDEERIAQLLKTKSMAARFSPAKVTFEDLWTLNTNKLAVIWPPNPDSKSGLPYDGSSVDQAFFNHLAYGFGNNCDAMERIAARPDCLLQRQKWNERPDYRRATILKAVAIPKQWKRRNAAVAERAAVQEAVSVAATRPPTFQASQPIATTVGEHVVPAAPATMPTLDEEAQGLTLLGGAHMGALFEGYVYINDMNRIVSPDGFVMDKAKFDAHPRFAKKSYLMDAANTKTSDSAWEGFVQSQVSPGRKVRGALFDPRQEPGIVVEREGQEFVNTWRPVPIEAVEGDVTPFLTHLSILFDDWRLLLNYLKFMVQCKGDKAMWWPFLYGMPGNGKSFINATMRYCIGRKFTQSPTAANLDSQFNASLYGCLFLAIEDIKVAEDYAKVWETIKPMVTQTELEVQPKGVDKVTREVCFNAILNSNHKAGIRKEPDDRRIAPFFSKQQRVGDLERDGLTEAYFDKLWSWAEGGGWAHVAYYLANDPIEAGFSAKKCPVTSSTAEHILVSRPPWEQDIIEAVRIGAVGYRGGWVNFTKVNNLLDSKRYRSTAPARRAMMEGLGYVPHPGLPLGQVLTPLGDSTVPVLYVLPNHTSIGVTDPTQIKAMYEAANKG
jgi:hypothetical protein